MIILDGRKTADTLYVQLSRECSTCKKTSKLVVLTFGEDPASVVYVRNKKRACEHVGVVFERHQLDPNTTVQAFEQFIKSTIEANSNVYDKFGIILQLPAPDEFVKVFNNSKVVSPDLDVDGFGDSNFSNLMMGRTPKKYPATPAGILTLLDSYNITVKGKHVVILGRSNIVGKPLAQMMLSRDATVTVCHSKTQNLKEITRTADILVTAIGKPRLINEEYIKGGVVIIDVGINRVEDGLCGDVDFERVKNKCYAITPVPGGVGPMTVYSLIENVLCSNKKLNEV